MATPEKTRVRATLADVATAARVSRSTASRALSGNGYAAPEVRRRVTEVAERLGYVPDANARSLKSQSTRTVGLLVSDLRNPFYAELAAGASSVLRGRDFTIVLVDDAGSLNEELAAARTFHALRASGVLLTPVSATATDYLLQQGLAVVEVDRRFSDGECDAVLIDNESSARELTRHLIRLGHRRIVLVIDEVEWTTGVGRLRGYLDALAEAGLPTDDSAILRCGFDMDVLAADLSRLLRSDQRPTAVFAANNVIAETAWRQLHRDGLRIPDDVSLVAFDDAPWMSLVDPGVTTVSQPAYDLGVEAARLLLSRVDNMRRRATVLLGTALVHRDSTAAPVG